MPRERPFAVATRSGVRQSTISEDQKHCELRTATSVACHISIYAFKDLYDPCISFFFNLAKPFYLVFIIVLQCRYKALNTCFIKTIMILRGIWQHGCVFCCTVIGLETANLIWQHCQHNMLMMAALAARDTGEPPSSITIPQYQYTF